MISSILEIISNFILAVIERTGYFGVTILMAFESAGIPIPSEIIMPFSGFLVTAGRFFLWPVVFWATLGNLIGSLALYIIGAYGGRRFILRYGRYFFFSEGELEKSDAWFKKYGSLTIFLGRMMPVVRTYISLPAGITKVNLPKFVIYTFVGSVPWNFGLAYVGVALGENWKQIEAYFRKFDYLILVLILIAVAWWLWRHFKATNIHS